MFRNFTHTTVAALVALLPCLASAQSFFPSYGCPNGRCGTSYYGTSSYTRPVSYGAANYNNQSILPGGCYGGSCPMQCGTTGACAQHGLVNCPQCQGRVGNQLPCAQHGLVNCPICQGQNQQYPVQYNVNGYGGFNSLPQQYPSNGQYFQPSTTNYRTRGSLQSLPMQPTWNTPVPSTYGNQNVSLY